MRVLMVCEKEGTAIWRLAKMTEKSAPWHSYKILCVHPKRPSKEQLDAFEDALRWCDIIDFRYWRTAELLKSMYEFTKKRAMLTHYNPYDLTRFSWAEYKINVVVNDEQLRILKHAARLIPLPVDLSAWIYSADSYYQENTQPYDIIMVVNRIEGKKGVLEVAQAVKDLGLKMALVGNISDGDYHRRCMESGADITFFENIPDEKLQDLYMRSRIHICNSVDNFESGTMPILESMASGVPVLTRKVGHVPELSDGTNMMVRRGAVDDIEDLKASIKILLEDVDLRMRMRSDAYKALRYRTLDLYGWRYSRFYHELLTGSRELVSVIMPTNGPASDWMKAAAHVLASQVDDLELIIVDDGYEDPEGTSEATIELLRRQTRFTIKYFRTARFNEHNDKVYGLAHARNKGILEAEGKYILFADDRMGVAPDAITKFKEKWKAGTWLWGIKDNYRKGFVENFSFISRDDIVRIGMFNTLIEQYGGMTQEVRKRAELNGIAFELVAEATVQVTRKSGNRFGKLMDVAISKAQCYKLYEG